MNPLVIAPIFEVVKQLLSGLGLDPEAKSRAQVQAFEILTKGSFEQNADVQLALAQLDVNKAEASSPGLFKGGWRPAVGWLCVSACAWNWVALPVAGFAFAAFGHPVAFEPADLSQMLPILIGMLGLGGLRTVEKMGGKS